MRLSITQNKLVGLSSAHTSPTDLDLPKFNTSSPVANGMTDQVW